MQKLLIFSQAISGHNIEYLEYLYIKLQELNQTAVFLTPSSITNSIVLLENDLIKFKSIDNNQIISDKKALAEELNKQCINENITHVLFMQLDILLLPIFLKKNYKCKVSAIYFEHFCRYKLTKQWRFWARGFKYITPLVHNKRVKSIFILNDKSGTKFLNRIYLKSCKFKFLPDPIDFSYISTIENIEFNLRQKYDLGNKKIITCIGSLDERKNTVNVIKALSLLNNSYHEKLALVIFGKAKPNENDRINDALVEINNANLKFTVIYENNRLTTKEFNDIIFQSDVLAIPYSGHVGSSGILGNAVKYKKKVIGSKTGLTAKLISKYNLGVIANEKYPANIAEAIERLLFKEYAIEGNFTGYLKDITPYPENFSSCILDSLVENPSKKIIICSKALILSKH